MTAEVKTEDACLYSCFVGKKWCKAMILCTMTDETLLCTSIGYCNFLSNPAKRSRSRNIQSVPRKIQLFVSSTKSNTRHISVNHNTLNVNTCISQFPIILLKLALDTNHSRTSVLDNTIEPVRFLVSEFLYQSNPSFYRLKESFARKKSFQYSSFSVSHKHTYNCLGC